MESQNSRVSKAVWGEHEGESVILYTLRSSRGLTAAISSFGATIVSLRTPDREGKMEDVVLGFDSHAEYIAKNPPFYMGSAVGRVSNRIRDGKFALNGISYQLTPYPPHKHHIHGGPKGFAMINWKPDLSQGNSEIHEKPDRVELTLKLHSADGEMGYPGNMDVAVTYWVTNQNEFGQRFVATCDKHCPISITTHSYFNLSGDAKRDITEQELTFESDEFLEYDPDGVPTGQFRKVEGTPMDFRVPRPIGSGLHADYDQIINPKGYNVGMIIRNGGGDKLVPAVKARDPTSGRVLEVFTNQPLVQFYSASFVDTVGRGGMHYPPYYGMCFEAHGYVDAVNHSHFPSTILKPGEIYNHETIHRFSVL